MWRPVQQHQVLLSVLLVVLLYFTTVRAICQQTYNPQTMDSCNLEQVPAQVNQNILTLIESEVERDDCSTSPMTTAPLTSSVPKDTTPPPTEPSTESPTLSTKVSTSPPTEPNPNTESPTLATTTTSSPTTEKTTVPPTTVTSPPTTVPPPPAANGTIQNPATSCKYIPRGSPSGNYWISGSSSATLRYCDMTRSCCGSTGGWMSVVNIDMRNFWQQCPSGFYASSSWVRSCRNPNAGCTSTVFGMNGIEYSKVCGRVIGYQYSIGYAFFGGGRGIDDTYVDGISITHGRSPRNHIWTFAAALNEVAGTARERCPCVNPSISFPSNWKPSFVGEDYFCDTGGYDGRTRTEFLSDRPLWDGQGCLSTSTCCTLNNPPWFCKQLPRPTRDDIEFRMCRYYTLEDTPFEIVDIYVQ